MEKKAKDDTLWYRIGCMYLHGIGTEPDEEQAERYLKKAYQIFWKRHKWERRKVRKMKKAGIPY